MSTTIAIGLLLLGIILFIAAGKGFIDDKTLQRAANVAGIVAFFAALFVLVPLQPSVIIAIPSPTNTLAKIADVPATQLLTTQTPIIVPTLFANAQVPTPSPYPTPTATLTQSPTKPTSIPPSATTLPSKTFTPSPTFAPIPTGQVTYNSMSFDIIRLKSLLRFNKFPQSNSSIYGTIQSNSLLAINSGEIDQVSRMRKIYILVRMSTGTIKADYDGGKFLGLYVTYVYPDYSTSILSTFNEGGIGYLYFCCNSSETPYKWNLNKAADNAGGNLSMADVILEAWIEPIALQK